MKRIKTKVVHSQSKPAWNIVSEMIGGKYKIARIPYQVCETIETLSTKNKFEALEQAEFISKCFNNYTES